MSETTQGTSARGVMPRGSFDAGTDNGSVVTYQVFSKEHLGPIRASSGKVTGHGEFAFRFNDTKLLVPPAAALLDGKTRPVVVLLDGTVRDSDFLTGDYVTHAVGWDTGFDALETMTARPDLSDPVGTDIDYPSHYAHATFIAGLLRQTAPDARVVSFTVADDQGSADERRILAALRWLNGTHGQQDSWVEDVVAVLLPSGRRLPAWQAKAELESNDWVLEDLRHEIVELGRRKITFVASAGNWGSDERAYPAWFAQDLPNVVAVGALNDRQVRAPFSNWGDWVRAWEVATNLLSCTPFVDEDEAPRSATWGGTSFAAAVHAGRLAQEEALLRLVDKQESAAVVPLPVKPQEPKSTATTEAAVGP